MNNKQSQKNMWETILRTAKTKKKCMGCNRGVDHSEEASVFAYVSLLLPDAPKLTVQIEASLSKTNSIETAELKEDEKGWLVELDRLRGLLVSEKTSKSLREKELPALEKQVKEEGVRLEILQQEVERVSFVEHDTEHS